jgi:lipopolysaccharide/colanic/teichoic acid biosynthesis glycosyltransferase
MHSVVRSYHSVSDNPAISPGDSSPAAAIVDSPAFSLSSRIPEEGQCTSASPWCMSLLKRVFDVACVIPALLLLFPIIVLVSALVWITSEGPIFFQQERAGLSQTTFTVYKFRTMFHNADDRGPRVTKAGDPRLTPVGTFLRRSKLDEIPQLYNVLRGDMSLVGPRPKLPKFEHFGMLCRPGITGAATLLFAKEEQLLRNVPEEELEAFHVEVLSPIKKSLDEEYQARSTFFSDLGLLFATVLKTQEDISSDMYLPNQLR